MKRVVLLLLVIMMPLQAMASTVLITGSNRGIGFEFVKQYAEQGWDVIATTRKPEKSDALNALAKEYSNITVERMDVTRAYQVEALAKKYQGQPIDLLINNAGILGSKDKQKLGQLDYAELDQVINVNVKGPIRVSEAFLANVLASKQKQIVVLASALGSITVGPSTADLYWYKISKAGISIAMASLQQQLQDKGVTVLRLVPGMVNTDMLRQSGAFGRGKEAPESVVAMIAVIAKASPEMAKKIYNYDGSTIPN